MSTPLAPRAAAGALIAAILVAAPVDATRAEELRCVVADPTGTPLNVRATPNGDKVGTLPNGLVVMAIRTSVDPRGRPWALVRAQDTGMIEGWVFREFLACD